MSAFGRLNILNPNKKDTSMASPAVITHRQDDMTSDVPSDMLPSDQDRLMQLQQDDTTSGTIGSISSAQKDYTANPELSPNVPLHYANEVDNSFTNNAADSGAVATITPNQIQNTTMTNDQQVYNTAEHGRPQSLENRLDYVESELQRFGIILSLASAERKVDDMINDDLTKRVQTLEAAIQVLARQLADVADRLADLEEMMVGPGGELHFQQQQ